MSPGDLREHIFAAFRRDGDWPTYRDLEADLIDKGPLKTLLDKLPESDVVIEYPVSEDSRVRLTLSGIQKCPGGAVLVDGFLAVARLAGTRYLEERSDSKVTNGDMEASLGMSPDLAIQVSRILWDEGGALTQGASRGHDDDVFRFSLSPRAMYFREASTLEEYEAAADVVREIRRQEAELSGGLRPGTSDVPKGVGPAVPGSLLEELHPAVSKVADRFLGIAANAEAVRASLQVLEAFVQEVTGDKERSGRDLMAHAFRLEDPYIRMNSLETTQDKNEQEGFMFLTMGAMVGMRNIYSHGAPAALPRGTALEQLALVSFLIRRIEEAVSKRVLDLGLLDALDAP